MSDNTDRPRAVRCNYCEAVFLISEGPKDGRIPLLYYACICPECQRAFPVKYYYPTDEQRLSKGQ